MIKKIHIDLLKYKSRSFILFTGYKETGRILLLTSSMRTPEFLLKQWFDNLVPFHNERLGYDRFIYG